LQSSLKWNVLDDYAHLADAAGRAISPELRRTWQRMITKIPQRDKENDNLYDAVRAACARADVGALLEFYPQYR
jgi:hypothetical protein